MSAPQSVTSAREFLAAARRRKVGDLPPPVLMRELAECRRQLGIVLSVLNDFEDEERLHDVTGLTPSGGARLSPADVLILGQILADALAWREPCGPCHDCPAGPGKACPDHVEDETRSAAYLRLAGDLGIEVTR